jgi:hypothetical protein
METTDLLPASLLAISNKPMFFLLLTFSILDFKYGWDGEASITRYCEPLIPARVETGRLLLACLQFVGKNLINGHK